MSASTLTVKVEGNPFMDGYKDSFKVILDWKSEGGGAGSVSKAICSTYAAQKTFGDFSALPKKIRGIFQSFETIPGLLGDKTTTCPTDAYDITLLNAYGYDVMGGNGANRSSSVAQFVTATSDVNIDSDLTLTIAAAGDDKTGRIILYFKPLEY